jgi:hypothetical protein
MSSRLDGADFVERWSVASVFVLSLLGPLDLGRGPWPLFPEIGAQSSMLVVCAHANGRSGLRRPIIPWDVLSLKAAVGEEEASNPPCYHERALPLAGLTRCGF